MGRCGYLGGSTIFPGPWVKRTGRSIFDPAQGIKNPKGNSGKGSNKNKTYTDERTIIDHIITRKLDPNIKKEFPKNTDPKLKKLVSEKYEDPYEWAKQQPLFKDCFLKIRKGLDNKQKKKDELDARIGDEPKLKKNIDQLQKKRTELSDKIADIDQQILLLKTALENK